MERAVSTVGENEVSTAQTDVFTLEMMKKGSSPDGDENEEAVPTWLGL